MVSLFNYDEDLIQEYASEFVGAKFPGSEYSFTCIYRSADFPDERQVFMILVAGQQFALKVDTTSPETGRLSAEFSVLNKLLCLFFSL